MIFAVIDKRIVAMLLFALICVSSPAFATLSWHTHSDKSERRMQVSVAKPMTMSEAIAVAKRQQPGKVLSAKRKIDKKGRTLFRIKMLSPEGVVRVIKVDAPSS